MQTNDDLPSDSSYRSVTPMAATLRFKNGKGEVTPFVIDYESFNDRERYAVPLVMRGTCSTRVEAQGGR